MDHAMFCRSHLIMHLVIWNKTTAAAVQITTRISPASSETIVDNFTFSPFSGPTKAASFVKNSLSKGWILQRSTNSIGATSFSAFTSSSILFNCVFA